MSAKFLELTPKDVAEGGALDRATVDSTLTLLW